MLYIANMEKEFANELRRLRQNLKLTQQQVADKLKVGRLTITYYETGRSLPSIKMLVKLCEILKTTPNELLGFK